MIKGLDMDTGQTPLMIPTCKDICLNEKTPLNASDFSFAHSAQKCG
jgi:hypothetical protein